LHRGRAALCCRAVSVLEAARPTAVPAVAFLPWLAVYAFLPAWRGGKFFTLASVVTLAVVEGPWLTLGLVAAVVLGYALVEGVFRLPVGWRRWAFLAVLLAMHAAYWASFHLPVPEVFRHAPLRDADRAPVFVLFSGIGATFLRMVSYAWDRWRGVCGRTGLRDYLTYMLFFPQFRHGPLERYGDVAAQVRSAAGAWGLRDAAVGLGRVAIALATLGLLVAVGAAAGRYVPEVFGRPGLPALLHPERLSAGELLLLMHAPLVLLYLLESSYARLQLGVSRAFGVRGTENFHYPLLAGSPREVWHRWNITVSTWLRDYAYIPLGGSRRHKYRNIVLVFVYCGLLHALQWRCIAWGLWTGGTLALFVWLTDRWNAYATRTRSVDPEVAGRHAVEPFKDSAGARRLRHSAQAVLRWLGGVAARILTFHWLAIGVTIVLDPEYCGARVLARYLQWLSGGWITLPLG